MEEEKEGARRGALLVVASVRASCLFALLRDWLRNNKEEEERKEEV